VLKKIPETARLLNLKLEKLETLPKDPKVVIDATLFRFLFTFTSMHGFCPVLSKALHNCPTLCSMIIPLLLLYAQYL
jgi:hypothetical protein